MARNLKIYADTVKRVVVIQQRSDHTHGLPVNLFETGDTTELDTIIEALVRGKELIGEPQRTVRLLEIGGEPQQGAGTQ